jgi:hypothetical protein
MNKLICCLFATAVYAAPTCESYFNKYITEIGECTKVINEKTELQFQCYNGFVNLNKNDNSMLIQVSKDDITTEMMLGKSEEFNKTYCAVFETDEYGVQEAIYDEYQKFNLLNLYKKFKKSNLKQKPSAEETRLFPKIFEETNETKQNRNQGKVIHELVIKTENNNVSDIVWSNKIVRGPDGALYQHGLKIGQRTDCPYQWKSSNGYCYEKWFEN